MKDLTSFGIEFTGNMEQRMYVALASPKVNFKELSIKVEEFSCENIRELLKSKSVYKLTVVQNYMNDDEQELEWLLNDISGSLLEGSSLNELNLNIGSLPHHDE
mmetsp:Transcript_41647/g.37041  ORF Transcript_41647/g.37041 Transcript_41647/m.37041 type:complete len:104 (+) Transcript_41647:2344-2655(+)